MLKKKKSANKEDAVSSESTEKKENVVVSNETSVTLSADEHEQNSADSENSATSKGKFKKLLKKLKSKRFLPVIVLLIIAAISASAYALPASRFAILNTVSKADAHLTILNETTKQPISGVIVTLNNGSSSETNKDGVAFFNDSKFGKTTATIQKNTYEAKTVDFVITSDGADLGKVELKPLGVPVNINAKSWLSGKALGEFKVYLNDSDKETVVGSVGTATLNIPYETPKLTLKITADGYNDLTLNVDINNDSINKEPSSKDAVSIIDANMVISGEHYFISDREGDISFYSVNYDGTNVQKLVTTNQKTDYLEYYSIPDTENYIAVLASSGKPIQGRQDQLALIKPDEKSLKIVDEAPGQKLDFSVISVNKDVVVYQVAYAEERADKFKIKSYNFTSGKLTTHYTSNSYIYPTYDKDRNSIYIVKNDAPYTGEAGSEYKLIKINLANNQQTDVITKENIGYLYTPESKPDKLLISIYDSYFNTMKAGFYLMDLKDNSKIEYLGADWTELDEPDEIPDSEKGQASPNKSNRVWIDVRDSKGRLILNESSNVIKGEIDKLSVNNIIRWLNETQLTVSGSDGSESADFIVDIETGSYKKITNTMLPQYGGY